MTTQLQLVAIPATPVLTARQQTAYDAIQQAGSDGLATDELGALLHRHGRDDRCEWCPRTGLEVGRALRAKGLVRQRRRRAPGGDSYMVWTVAGKVARPDPGWPDVLAEF